MAGGFIASSSLIRWLDERIKALEKGGTTASYDSTYTIADAPAASSASVGVTEQATTGNVVDEGGD